MKKYVFIRYKSPTAFANYIALESDWKSASTYISLTHLISGVVYNNCQKSSLMEIEWKDIPMGYRIDAWHFNPTVRELTENPLIQADKIGVRPGLSSVIQQTISDLATENNIRYNKIKSLENTVELITAERNKLHNELSNKTKNEVDKYIDTLNNDSPFKQARIESLTEALKRYEAELKKAREVINGLQSHNYQLKQVNNITAKNLEQTETDLKKFKDLYTQAQIKLSAIQLANNSHYGKTVSENLPLPKLVFGQNSETKTVQEYAEQNFNKQNNTEMNLSNVIPNFKFGKLDNSYAANIALSMAGVAFKKITSGLAPTWVVFNREEKKLIEVGDLKFDVEFYQIPVQSLNEGDITIFDGHFFIVEKQNADGSLSLIHPTSGSRSNKLARTNILNMYFYTKVVSMFDMMGGAFNQTAGQNNNLFGNINPMMFMMMDKQGDSSSFMEMMMMSQLFNGGNNPFTQVAIPVKKQRTTKATSTIKTTSTRKK